MSLTLYDAVRDYVEAREFFMALEDRRNAANERLRVLGRTLLNEWKGDGPLLYRGWLLSRVGGQNVDVRRVQAVGPDVDNLVDAALSLSHADFQGGPLTEPAALFLAAVAAYGPPSTYDVPMDSCYCAPVID